MFQESLPSWLKSKGYLHITPRVDVHKHHRKIISNVTNPEFISTYAFFPLVHAVIKQRRYKKIPHENRRGHSYKENGIVISSAKERPLHYSNNMDAIIFGYYAEQLQEKYEMKLSENEELSNSIIAYRKIPTGFDNKNKSTIHFAKDAFDEIKLRSSKDCAVLLFDIKSFFSRMDHKVLENAWLNIMDVNSLPPDHKNVFKAATKFSYILKDDLRLASQKSKKKRRGYDEKRLSEIRKHTGKFCYFESTKEFRDKLKNKELKVYKYPFRNDKKEPVGIPQGLAISAVLANIYLYEFDYKVFELVVNRLQGYYRRYSDDILIACDTKHVSEIKKFIYTEIENSKVEISKEKTEEYLFKNLQISPQKRRLTSIKITEDICKIGVPITYLGFEFYGYQTLIKSANLAKFYRRMIRAVKSKAKRAKELCDKSPLNKQAIFRRQLYKLYTIQDLNITKVRSSLARLQKNERGYYDLKITKIEKPLRSNYLSYVRRASEIMEEPAIENQIRNHTRIFNDAINKHLKRQFEA